MTNVVILLDSEIANSTLLVSNESYTKFSAKTQKIAPPDRGMSASPPHRSSRASDQQDRDRQRRHEHKSSSSSSRDERWSREGGGDDRSHHSKGSDEHRDERRHHHHHHHHRRRSPSPRVERGRDRDRSRERNYDRPTYREGERRAEEVPNSTIMVRNLGGNATEAELRSEITHHGLEPKVVRVMRKKDQNRSFAFVEFGLLSEAIRWKELTRGVLFLDGVSRSTLHYSLPKESFGSDRHSPKVPAEWICSKCGTNNFRRRESCFKCDTAKDGSTGDGENEISAYPSNTLLFRNLGILTTEERVLSMLGQLTTLPIKSLRVVKDDVTRASKGFAYVELHSTTEATQLHDLLLSMAGNFFVDGRLVTVSYARRSLSSMNGSTRANAASVALAAAQWTNQEANKSDHGTVVVNGVSYRRYPVPDTLSYSYDEASGYYYDPSTGFYYDSNSHYYYCSEKQQYLYWDNDRQTYLPASSTPVNSTAAASSVGASATKATDISTASTKDKRAEPSLSKKEAVTPKAEKQDKVKVAKKIAKEMEKWAKTLNQKKEIAKLGISPSAMFPFKDNSMTPASSADAGFAVLERSADIVAEPFFANPSLEPTSSLEMFADPSVTYGRESQSNADDEVRQAQDLLKQEELKLLDWEKMACLMCKRRFPNRETLTKHQQMSDLHKQNLNVLKLTTLTPHQMRELSRREEEEEEAAGYRDRAKERRLKFGQPDVPPPSKLKSRYLRGREAETVQAEQPTRDGIGADNIGNKMLKAMGWTEGQGLGKSGQGMSGIIEVQQRSKTAGLGMKGATYGATASDSYKEAVKKAMLARFKEVSDD